MKKYINYKDCFDDIINYLKKCAYDILIKEIRGEGDAHIHVNECIYYLECNINEYEKSPDDFYEFLYEFIEYYRKSAFTTSDTYYFYELLCDALSSVKSFKTQC